MGGIAPPRRPAAAFTAVLALWCASAVGSAQALSPPTPWDGVNPFRCTVQDAGRGTTVPDPGADPYCVRFDKTNQNVTELGLVDFLSKEPARFGAAAPKCFYYQEDPWRGSVVQSDQSTVLYEFFGHYFFDKATGDGGVWVTDFRLAGQTADPRTLPGFPPQYDGYYGPGTGGFVTHNDVPTDPACVAKAQQEPAAVYATQTAHCPRLGGRLGRRRVGPVRIGMPERRVRTKLGPPQSFRRGLLHYCVASGGELVLGNKAHRARVAFVVTASRGFTLIGRRARRVTVGTPTGAVRRAFARTRRILRLGDTVFLGLGARRAPK